MRRECNKLAVYPNSHNRTLSQEQHNESFERINGRRAAGPPAQFSTAKTAAVRSPMRDTSDRVPKIHVEKNSV